jgi:hypothetical protein
MDYEILKVQLTSCAAVAAAAAAHMCRGILHMDYEILKVQLTSCAAVAAAAAAAHMCV